MLNEALRRAGYAALAQWTLHNREHLVLLRPGRFGLLVHSLFYADEVQKLDEFRTETERVVPHELELAHRLIESLAGPFEPAKYQDTYRQNLRTLIDTKIRGDEWKLGAERPVIHPVRFSRIWSAGLTRRTMRKREHWAPRDAVRLMANLVLLPIEDKIKSGTYLLYDCAAVLAACSAPFAVGLNVTPHTLFP